MASSDLRKVPHATLISPHQNEQAVAIPSMRILKKRLLLEGIQTDNLKILKNTSNGWDLRKKLSEKPKLPSSDEEEIRNTAHFVLTILDIANRARVIDHALIEKPNSLVIEVHGFIPDSYAGSGGTPEMDLGNNISVLHFFHITNAALESVTGLNEKLAGKIASLIKFDIDEAWKQLYTKISKRLINHKDRVLCLEIPGKRAVPMIKNDSQLHSIYFDETGNLHKHITEFENLYCINAVIDNALVSADIERVYTFLFKPLC